MSTLIARVARTWCLRADDPTCILSALLASNRPVPLDVAENALFNLKKTLQRVEAVRPDGFRRSARDLRAAIDGLQIKIDKGVPMNVAGESVEGRELDLYAENNSALYPQKVAILRNLLLKMRRGVYDPNKAVILWAYWYESAARAYAREFSVGTDWSAMFPKRIRLEAASLAEVQYRKELIKGEHNYALTARDNPMENNMHTPYCTPEVPPHSHKIHGYAAESPVPDTFDAAFRAYTNATRAYKKAIRAHDVAATARHRARIAAINARWGFSADGVPGYFAESALENPFSQSEKTGGLIAAVAVGAAALIYALWPKKAAASSGTPSSSLPAGVTLETCTGSAWGTIDPMQLTTIEPGLYRVQAAVDVAKVAAMPDAVTAPAEIISAIQAAAAANMPFQIEFVYIDAFTTSAGQVVGPIVYPSGAVVPSDWPQVVSNPNVVQGASLPQIKIRGQVRLLQSMPASGMQSSLTNANNNGVVLDGVWACQSPSSGGTVNTPNPSGGTTSSSGGTTSSSSGSSSTISVNNPNQSSPHQNQQLWAPVTKLKQGKQYRISAGVPAVLQTNHFNDFKMYRDADVLPGNWPAQDKTTDPRWRVEGTWPMADYTIPASALTDAYGNPRFYELV